MLASVELLANIAERVEGRWAAVGQEIDGDGTVLAAAPPPRALLSDPLPDDNPGLVASRGQHLAALARLQESDADAVGEPLRAFLSWQLQRELALLRTGMYKS